MIKDILRLSLILFAISALATGILAWVNSVTLPTITQLKAKDAENTRRELMPEAKSFEAIKATLDTSFVYYIAKSDKGETLGYSVVAEKHGYSSNIKTMVALDMDFTIITLKVYEQAETPGLGTHCQDKTFPDKFKGKELDALKVDKDGGTIKSITGATITTRAITNSLREAISLVKSDLEARDKGGVQ